MVSAAKILSIELELPPNFYILLSSKNKISSMSYRDQKKYFETLRRYERKFSSDEKQNYDMLVKRHKDDEDLDKASMEFLRELYEKYLINRPKPNYDHLFKKPDEDD